MQREPATANADPIDSARDFAQPERPLEGLRVLELDSLIAGPFATRIMAEFGAEVIKARPPLRGRSDLTGPACIGRNGYGAERRSVA